MSRSPVSIAPLVSLIAPPRCGTCGSRCAADAALCGRCEIALGRARPDASPIQGLDAAWSAAPYEGTARELVAALKFRRRLPLARRAAEAIASRAPPEHLRGTLVPVPPDPWRARARGLDPAEEIALALAAISGLPLAACLARAPGPRQVGRPRAERLANPPRIRLRGPAPRQAVLVDDVLTTGATLAGCAQALCAAGSERVVALTFARSTLGK